MPSPGKIRRETRLAALRKVSVAVAMKGVAMKLTVYINHDPDTECPNEQECTWRLVSFNNRHVNYEDREKYFPLTIGLRRKLEVGTAFILDYSEHGLCRWGVEGTIDMPSWDSSSCAGILLWEHNPSVMGAKTYEERKKNAEYFCEKYTDWANGNCYWIEILDAEGKEVERSGGIIGDDALTEALNESIEEGDQVIVRGDRKWLAQYLHLNGTIIEED